MTAADKILQKSLVAADVDSREWSKVQAGIRDRAFFSAKVTETKILAAMRENVVAILKGDKSESEARRDLREFYQTIGHPRGDGSIKDLYSKSRLDVMLKTNCDQARGYVSHLRATTTGAILAFPAYELVRVEQRKLPRDWSARWRTAGNSVGWQGALKDRFIALKTSPIWMALSAFGNPFPPFDFNSGMGVRDVPKSTCRDLGLLQPDEQPTVPPAPDFNQNLTASVPGLSTADLAHLRATFGDQVRITSDTAAWQNISSLKPPFRLPSPSGLATVTAQALAGLAPDLLHLVPSVIRSSSPIELLSGGTLAATITNGIVTAFSLSR